MNSQVIHVLVYSVTETVVDRLKPDDAYFEVKIYTVIYRHVYN